jgi:hypothetical protein
MNASETLDDFEPKVALAAAKRNEFCDILRLTSSCRRQSHATQNTVLFIRSNGVADDIVSTMSSSSFESTIGQSTVADLCQIVAQSNTLSSSSSTSSTSQQCQSARPYRTPMSRPNRAATWRWCCSFCRLASSRCSLWSCAASSGSSPPSIGVALQRRPAPAALVRRRPGRLGEQ